MFWNLSIRLAHSRSRARFPDITGDAARLWLGRSARSSAGQGACGALLTRPRSVRPQCDMSNGSSASPQKRKLAHHDDSDDETPPPPPPRSESLKRSALPPSPASAAVPSRLPAAVPFPAAVPRPRPRSRRLVPRSRRPVPCPPRPSLSPPLYPHPISASVDPMRLWS